jgi:hypothetical protein
MRPIELYPADFLLLTLLVLIMLLQEVQIMKILLCSFL